jgi:hypothetical protein
MPKTEFIRAKDYRPNPASVYLLQTSPEAVRSGGVEHVDW